MKKIKTNSRGGQGLRRRTFLGVILAFALSMLGTARILGQEAVSEEQLKAAFLFNFVRYVEWPQNAFSSENSPIVIGVLSNEEFATRLAALLKEKKAHNRSFEVKKLSISSDGSGCHMIFVPLTESKRAGQVAENTKKQPVLLVGEHEEFLDSGGIITFVKDKGQLRFDINPKAAEDRNLVISSHLLRLARTKKGGSQ